MTTPNTALKAAQGIDTQDLLNHIAWTDVILPKLLEAKSIITSQLVTATLSPSKEGTCTKEQLAGQLFGIDYITKTIEKILREGSSASESLARENLFLQ